MDRWRGKVAMVTGASAGIGLAICKALIAHGVNVVGLSRRKGLMEESMKDVKGTGKFYAKECDITKEEDVIEALNWIKSTLGTLNILINNAGVIKHAKFEDVSTSVLENTYKVNVIGVVYCIKQSIKLMKESNQESHIININSVLGHTVLQSSIIPFNVYPSSKFAVTGLTETLRNELSDSKIRITSVSPGLVKTVMRDNAVKFKQEFSGCPSLDPEDVADAVIYSLGVPPNVEINELTLQAKYL